jgi:transcriptional regulator with XRE-family HTH domain
MLVKATSKQKLASLLRELRGERSQRSFAQFFGVSNQAVQNWEKERTWPDDDNLQKLADLKGWTLKQLQAYLEGVPQAEQDISYTSFVETELTLNVQQLLAQVRSLPFQAAAQVAQAALETMAIKGEQAS